MRMAPKTVLKLISYWPPYFFSGIRVKYVSEDLTHVRVGLGLRFYNRNYFGTHFGGSLYSMCDPFYVFMLAHKLGKDHIIWDKAAEIEFLKAVATPVHADFKISPEQIENIKKSALENFKVEPIFETSIVDPDGQEIAKIKKVLYVRRKDAKERFA